jgi:hypothetical protein
MSKRFWYTTKKELDILKIYYRLEDDGKLQIYQTQTRRIGNKRVKLIRTLMKNNWPIVTKRLTTLNLDLYKLELNKEKWKEIDQEEMLSYLRRGNPDDNARSSLFAFFGYNIFGLTNLEMKYFKASFHNLPRLVKFYHAVKKECRARDVGYTHRSYGGRNVVITPAKIKKAIEIIFGENSQEVLFGKEKNNGKS